MPSGFYSLALSWLSGEIPASDSCVQYLPVGLQYQELFWWTHLWHWRKLLCCHVRVLSFFLSQHQLLLLCLRLLNLVFPWGAEVLIPDYRMLLSCQIDLDQLILFEDTYMKWLESKMESNNDNSDIMSMQLIQLFQV